MRLSLCCAVLVWTATALSAAAQTPATPGGVTRNGVVTLGTGSTPIGTPYGPATTSAQSSSPTTTAGAGQGAGSGGGAVAFGGRSIAAGNLGPATSARANAGSSGGGSGAPSGGVPAWVVCPPSGALGTQPFLTGTDLSCAP